MTLIDIIRKAYPMGTGRSKEIVDGDDNFVRIRDIINYHRRDLADTRDTNWRELYREHVITGVTATSVYPITEYLRISPDEGDYVKVVYGDNKTSNYRIVKRTQLNRRGGQPISGQSSTDSSIKGECGFWGGMLVFRDPFTMASPEYGPTSRILVPHYIIPDDLVNATDEHVFPHNPNYLIIMAAWQIAIDDKVTPDRQDSLEALSQSAYQALLTDNTAPGQSVERNELGAFYYDL